MPALARVRMIVRLCGPSLDLVHYLVIGHWLIGHCLFVLCLTTSCSTKPAAPQQRYRCRQSSVRSDHQGLSHAFRHRACPGSGRNSGQAARQLPMLPAPFILNQTLVRPQGPCAHLGRYLRRANESQRGGADFTAAVRRYSGPRNGNHSGLEICRDRDLAFLALTSQHSRVRAHTYASSHIYWHTCLRCGK